MRSTPVRQLMVFALCKRELQVSFVVSDLEQNHCFLSASNPFLFACQCLSTGIKHLPNVGLGNVKQPQAMN